MDMLNKGNKHTCSNCEARFFDLLKPTATCPKCGTVDQTETGRIAALKLVVETVPVKSKDPEEHILDLDDDDADDDADEDEDSLMEDTSDLGFAEDDVTEVLDNLERPEPSDG